MGCVSSKTQIHSCDESRLKKKSFSIKKGRIGDKYCCAKKNGKKKMKVIEESNGTQTTFNSSFIDKSDRGEIVVDEINSAVISFNNTRDNKTRSPSKESCYGVGGTRASTAITALSYSSSKKLTEKVKKKTIMHSRIIRGDIKKFYVFDNTVLGTGISGAVRKARHISTNRMFAVKSLSTQNISPKKASMLYNEVAIYLQLDHPNIAKLFEVYEDETAIHLVMEQCTGKELYDRLATKRKYSENDAINVTKQMLSAISYCHSHRICHRDLKLENWVYADMSENAALKLIDFGFSRIFNPGVPMTAMHGTVYYVSPEVMDGCYTQFCDIWSIGVIVYMLLSGSPPFNGNADHEILVKIKKGTFSMEGHRWNGISLLAKQFVSHLLRKNPKERPSAEAALKYAWLNQHHSIDVDIDINVLKSMQKFAAGSAMKRAALALISLSMDTKEVEDLEKLFKKIDSDGNGTIKLEELAAVLKEKLNISDEEALRIFKRMDQTGDSEIHYSEFLASTLQARVVLDESWIRQAFQRFDVDNTGYISLSNLKEIFGERYDDIRIKEILDSCDLNHSGDIDYDEFLAAITRDDAYPPSLLPSQENKETENGKINRPLSKSLLEVMDTLEAADKSTRLCRISTLDTNAKNNIFSIHE